MFRHLSLFIAIILNITVLSFVTPTAQAQEYTETMQYEDAMRSMQNYYGSRGSGTNLSVDDASNIPVYENQGYHGNPPPVPQQPYQAPSESYYPVSCPDGTMPILGFCGQDIPREFR